jgi:hypothetical protein
MKNGLCYLSWCSLLTDIAVLFSFMKNGPPMFVNCSHCLDMMMGETMERLASLALQDLSTWDSTVGKIETMEWSEYLSGEIHVSNSSL